jgi:CheY-like chemotaxis protein
VARILVVDDEPAQRFALRRILERAGHEVTDDGNELIRRLRSEPATAGIAILASTGDPCLAVGADAIISKPVKCEYQTKVAEGLLREGRGAR